MKEGKLLEYVELMMKREFKKHNNSPALLRGSSLLSKVESIVVNTLCISYIKKLFESFFQKILSENTTILLEKRSNFLKKKKKLIFF